LSHHQPHLGGGEGGRGARLTSFWDTSSSSAFSLGAFLKSCKNSIACGKHTHTHTHTHTKTTARPTRGHTKALLSSLTDGGSQEKDLFFLFSFPFRKFVPFDIAPSSFLGPHGERHADDGGRRAKASGHLPCGGPPGPLQPPEGLPHFSEGPDSCRYASPPWRGGEPVVSKMSRMPRQWWADLPSPPSPAATSRR